MLNSKLYEHILRRRVIDAKKQGVSDLLSKDTGLNHMLENNLQDGIVFVELISQVYIVQVSFCLPSRFKAPLFALQHAHQGQGTNVGILYLIYIYIYIYI